MEVLVWQMRNENRRKDKGNVKMQVVEAAKILLGSLFSRMMFRCG